VISVYQEDCSTHEVHRWQNYDCHSFFGFMEQPEQCSNYQGIGYFPLHCGCGPTFNTWRRRSWRYRRLGVVPHCFFLVWPLSQKTETDGCIVWLHVGCYCWVFVVINSIRYCVQEEDVETIYGSVSVIVEGDRSKPAILTYHDIGLNSYVNFLHFLAFHFKRNFVLRNWFQSVTE